MRRFVKSGPPSIDSAAELGPSRRKPISIALCAALVLAAFIEGRSTATAADLQSVAAGQVRFFNVADSDFDDYSRSPSAGEAAWMRDHYTRMLTYTSYFDSRTAWYPNALVYKNAYGVPTDSPLLTTHPNWVLRDASGRRLYVPWGCSNGTCPQYAGDFGNPAFRSHWIDRARDILARGYRGIWIDDVNLTWRVGDGNGDHVKPIDPRSGQTMTLDDWRRYFAEFMEEIRAAFPDAEIAHNGIWFSRPWNDPYIIRQIEAADYYNLERGANDAGLRGGDGKWGFETFLNFIDFVHARGRKIIFMDYGKSSPEREYGLGAWFLISNGTDLMNSNRLAWTTPDNFWQGYELDLGTASGERYHWNDVLRRDFQCGLVLLNQPDMPARTVELGGQFTRIDGSKTSSVQLGAASSAVLTKPCAADVAPAAPTDVTAD